MNLLDLGRPGPYPGGARLATVPYDLSTRMPRFDTVASREREPGMSTDRPAPLQHRAPARIGYAAGAFDLFHVGHLNILRQAKTACDYLIAGVVSDEMLVLAKGTPPVVPLAERLEIVRHISFVDEAVAETVPDKLDTWRALGFDVFVKGDDWRGTPRGLALERQFAEVGVEVVYFPYTVHTSSTALRRALEALSPPVAPVATAGAERADPDYSAGIRA